MIRYLAVQLNTKGEEECGSLWDEWTENTVRYKVGDIVSRGINGELYKIKFVDGKA